MVGSSFLPKVYIGKSLSKFLIKSLVSKLYPMPFYDKITDSEGLDTSESTHVIRTGVVSCKWCDFCHFYFFKNKNFNSQPHACNGFHEASLHAQLLTDFKIIMIKSGAYSAASNMKKVLVYSNRMT